MYMLSSDMARPTAPVGLKCQAEHEQDRQHQESCPTSGDSCSALQVPWQLEAVLPRSSALAARTCLALQLCPGSSKLSCLAALPWQLEAVLPVSSALAAQTCLASQVPWQFEPGAR